MTSVFFHSCFSFVLKKWCLGSSGTDCWSRRDPACLFVWPPSCGLQNVTVQLAHTFSLLVSPHTITGIPPQESHLHASSQSMPFPCQTGGFYASTINENMIIIKYSAAMHVMQL
ncbi:hypothetical protein ATANTOWER_006840 [Ataeniobius toweri]|uniref:Uncharacterized protein n=1 Tax=Ataeniobius toweri TaxID=208326 RepID=A0ABU7BVD9_9TELE|nr:hypothetical protein [Ataeniobius toweri]